MTTSRLLDRIDAGSALSTLAAKQVNFSIDEVDARTWNHDTWRTPLPSEEPGPPERHGAWETACRLVEAYEFSDPHIVRAVYRLDAPLLGRDMLLEGRFAVLRFYIGVRVTEVIDERRTADGVDTRVWGWVYETLEGHLERGRMSYEVVKDEHSGEVEFAIAAYSQAAPSLGPVTGLGWRLFGRRTQLRFYRTCGFRLADAVAERRGSDKPVSPRMVRDGLVLAPSDTRRRRTHHLSLRRHQPG